MAVTVGLASVRASGARRPLCALRGSMRWRYAVCDAFPYSDDGPHLAPFTGPGYAESILPRTIIVRGRLPDT